MAHRHYFRPARKIWRCAGCREDYSVTSGTIFAFHKLPLRLYPAAAILFANAVKGISALQMGSDLGVSHRSTQAGRGSFGFLDEAERGSPSKANELRYPL